MGSSCIIHVSVGQEYHEGEKFLATMDLITKRKIQTTTGRGRLNLHGAMNGETLEMTVIESETVNEDSTIQLLEML